MKIKKILKLTAACSLCAAFAFGGIVSIHQTVQAFADEIQYETVGTIDLFAREMNVSDGAEAAYGKKDINDNLDVSGLVLTGGASATFDLGTINLKNSYWDSETDYMSFIDFVVTPTKGATTAELTRVDFVLSDMLNPEKTIEIRTSRSGTSTTQGVVRALATDGTKTQYPAAYNAVEEKYVYAGSGVGKATPYLHSETAESVTPISLVYDVEENAAYTPNSSKYNTAYGRTYLIRDFDDDSKVYQSVSDATEKTQTLSSCTYSSSGKFNLMVRFYALEAGVTSSSIVITKLAGEDMTVNTEVQVPVNEYETVDDFAASITKSEFTTAEYGTKTLNNVQVGKGYETEYSGLVLTGEDGATFTFNTPINLKDCRWQNSSYFDSFIEFVFAPSENYLFTTQDENNETVVDVDALNKAKAEIMCFTITLTDAHNPNNKITVSLNQQNISSDVYTNPRSNLITQAQYMDENGVLQVQQSGTYRLNKGVEQFSSYGVLVSGGRKGNSRSPFRLVYDWEKNAMYTPDVASNYPGSYLLRDYDESYVDYAFPGAPMVQDMGVTFPGFSTGEVYVSISFDNALTESSVVITKFAGHDLQNGEFTVSHENDALELTAEKLVYSYGDEIRLPNVMKMTNAIQGEKVFLGNYEILKNGTLVKSGAYADGLIANDLPIGKYTVKYTSVYGSQKTAILEVNPTVSYTGEHIDVYVDGVPIDGVFNLSKDAIVELIPDEGYEITEWTLNGMSQTMQTVELNYSELTENIVIALTVAPINYIVEFDFYTDIDTNLSYNPKFYNVETRAGMELPMPSMEGYTFLGWYNGSTCVRSGAELPLKDVTLIGIFGQEQYRIYYYENGENSEVSRISSVSNCDTEIAYIPKREGYIFGGWYTQDNVKMDFSQSISQDIALYALWKPIETLDGETQTKDNVFVNTTDVNSEPVSGCASSTSSSTFVLVVVSLMWTVSMIIIKNKKGDRSKCDK